MNNILRLQLGTLQINASEMKGNFKKQLGFKANFRDQLALIFSIGQSAVDDTLLLNLKFLIFLPDFLYSGLHSTDET